MITWSKLNFQNPNNNMIEIIFLIIDYLIMFVCSIIILVIINLIFVIKTKNFLIFNKENHQLETLWTIIPFFILISIAIPSILSLYNIDSRIFCGLSLIITGNQWYWTYNLNRPFNLNFNSYIIDNKTLKLLEVDNRIILPRNTPIQINLSSSDVIHSWTIPSLGVKIDCIPGRINQFNFSCKNTGVFFGQCSEICGTNHRFIPIVLEIIKNKDFIKIIN